MGKGMTTKNRTEGMFQQISARGKNGFPPSVTATSDPNFYKICTGNARRTTEETAQSLSLIMGDGISVVMVKSRAPWRAGLYCRSRIIVDVQGGAG
jgi:hypothetical protein